MMDIIDISDRLESLIRRIDMFGKTPADIKDELRMIIDDINADIERDLERMAELDRAIHGI